MDIWVSDKGVCRFGSFQIDPVKRRLMCEGQPVKLPPKQFDTLMYLVENPARVVEKDELLTAIWGNRIVEEGSLSQAVFLLRRALRVGGPDAFILTVPGRGYRLGLDVERCTSPGLRTGENLVRHLEEYPVSSNAVSKSELDWRAPGDRLIKRHFVLRLLPLLGGTSVLVVAVLIGLALDCWTRGIEPPGPQSEHVFRPPPSSVAVLAFTNLSGDPKQEYFSDGLAEELTNALGRLDGLQVAARMSAFTFKSGTATIDEIGRKLNVAAVLEGSVRREGTHFRVTAQLIDATTGFQYWSHNYDGPVSDTLTLEADIASAVAQTLKITLLTDRQAKLTIGTTRNPKAFDGYFRGLSEERFFSEEERFFSEASTRSAKTSFEEAVHLDAN